MKTRKIQFSHLSYTIDTSIVILFIAVTLDVISTTFFIALDVGYEANDILRDLIRISMWFIPLYLYITDGFFIPFISDELLRKTLSYTFSLLSLVLAINNFSLILFSSAFLIDWLGFYGSVILFVVFGVSLFIFLLIKEKRDTKETLITCLKLLLYLVFFGLLNLLFMVIGNLAF